MKFVQNQNENFHFIEHIIKDYGFPFWDHSKIFAIPNFENEGKGGNDASVIYVPFVRDSQYYVNSALIVRISESDTAFKWVHDYQYKGYGFTSSSAWDAQDIFNIFAILNTEVFSYHKFQITDGRIFSRDSVDNFFVYVYKDSSAYGKLRDWVQTHICNNVEICGECLGFKQVRRSLLLDFCCNPTTVTLCNEIWNWEGPHPPVIPPNGGGESGGGWPEPCGNCGTGGWIPDPAPLAELLADWDDEIIIDPGVRPCFISIFNDVKAISIGEIASMIHQMGGQIPAFDWEIIELSSFEAPYTSASALTAYTDIQRRSTTWFNLAVLGNATNISLARTILHEAIHAYFFDWIKNESSLTPTEKATILSLPYAKKLKTFMQKKKPLAGNAFHNQMVVNFLNELKDHLKALCPNIGINLSPVELELFCHDMAWGGLNEDQDASSPWMALLPEDRSRIMCRLKIEQENLSGFTGMWPQDDVNLTRVGIKTCP